MKDFLSFPFHVSLGLPRVEFGGESHPLDGRYPTQVLIHCEVYENKSLKTHKQKYLYIQRLRSQECWNVIIATTELV